MEPDSTTHDGSISNLNKSEDVEPTLPFATQPGNLQLYKNFINKEGDQRLEYQLVERLQSCELIPKSVKCLAEGSNCNVICRTARVVDRVQWICEGCGKTQPIRAGSFFFRLQCSILQSMQIILAWCEDADVDVVAAHFGVKPKVATQIYDKLDEIAIKEQSKCKLGGENSVVLVEMYPDCVNRLSPDTTDQPHAHRILMVADTNHIPTSYWLHVMKDDNKKTANGSLDTQALVAEISDVLKEAVVEGSVIVTGNNIPAVPNTSSIQKLLQHCDMDMQRFLTTRIWRQAVTLCCASRSICNGGLTAAACATLVQRYLTTSLYRLRHDDGFYNTVLNTIVAEYNKCDT
ncbi:hypothetical protein SFRURICE_009843 [Spodoptera frugiperda]|uniref:SFRICE_012538 n=1 Tax=Spodoptera frugiperda TaxID=7108 RepID=A0A2H1W4H4_SPOFR|nr:hypothetical protein SFRURICE_009843 [Spodoptera frugiperda]